MARTESTMLEIGTTAPDFTLLEPATGKPVSRPDKGPLLVAFICNHCPFVIHIADAFVKVAQEYQPKGVDVVAINSNDAQNYPADAPNRMIEEARARGFTFPYLYDESQAVAKGYRAACTPDFYLFDRALELVYRGRFDASRPGNDIPVTGTDLKAALDSVTEGRPTPDEQHASMGCSIKWKAGNAPEYFG